MLDACLVFWPGQLRDVSKHVGHVAIVGLGLLQWTFLVIAVGWEVAPSTHLAILPGAPFKTMRYFVTIAAEVEVPRTGF